jgi:hypothetical protein
MYGWMAVALLSGILWTTGLSVYSTSKRLSALRNENARLQSSLNSAERKTKGLRKMAARSSNEPHAVSPKRGIGKAF